MTSVEKLVSGDRIGLISHTVSFFHNGVLRYAIEKNLLTCSVRDGQQATVRRKGKWSACLAERQHGLATRDADDLNIVGRTIRSESSLQGNVECLRERKSFGVEWFRPRVHQIPMIVEESKYAELF